MPIYDASARLGSHAWRWPLLYYMPIGHIVCLSSCTLKGRVQYVYAMPAWAALRKPLPGSISIKDQCQYTVHLQMAMAGLNRISRREDVTAEVCGPNGISYLPAHRLSFPGQTSIALPRHANLRHMTVCLRLSYTSTLTYNGV